MAETTLKQKTAKGLFWGGFSSGILQLIYAVYGIWINRILSQDDFGMVTVLAIFSGVASTLVSGGFSVALINKQDATHKDYNAVFWFSVFMGLFLYVLLFFSAPLIARFYNQPELTALSRLVFTGFVFGAIGIVPSTILTKKLMAKQFGIIAIINLLISCSISLILAMKGYGYWAVAAQNVLILLSTCILTTIIAPWKPTFDFDFSPLKQIFSFSFKLLMTNIFSTINANIFAFILGKFYSLKDVGNYSQGQKWAAMGSAFINGMFANIAQPILVQVNDEKDRQVNALRKLIRLGAFISFPLMLGLAFVGKEFIIIAVGEKWLPAVPFLYLFCIWNSVSFLSTLFTNLIYSQGKADLYMKISIFTGLLQLAIIFGMYPFGIISMVAGYIVISFFGLFVWHHYVKKLIGLQLRMVLKDTLPYLGITLLCFGIVWLITRNIQNLYLLFVSKIIISGILYIFALKLSNSVMFKESMEFLMSRIKRK